MIAIEVGVRVNEVDALEVEQVVFSNFSGCNKRIASLNTLELIWSGQLLQVWRQSKAYVVVHRELLCGRTPGTLWGRKGGLRRHRKHGDNRNLGRNNIIESKCRKGCCGKVDLKLHFESP